MRTYFILKSNILNNKVHFVFTKGVDTKLSSMESINCLLPRLTDDLVKIIKSIFIAQ